MILGIDPGTEKCGLAVVEPGVRAPRLHLVVPRAQLALRVAELCVEHAIERIALGSGTQAAQVRLELDTTGVPVTIVDEHGTTLAARARYYEANPPRGWRRLIPRGLLVPTVPIDDWAAVLIAERYLAGAAATGGA